MKRNCKYKKKKESLEFKLNKEARGERFKIKSGIYESEKWEWDLCDQKNENGDQSLKLPDKNKNVNQKTENVK